MSQYGDDNRVMDMGDGTFEMLNRSGTGYTKVFPTDRGFVAVPVGSMYSGYGPWYATADEAIESQIGDPR